MTRLEYILDKKYDIEITLQLLDRKNSENDKDNFLKSIGISQNFDPNGSKRELIISYADRKYLTLANFLTRTLSLYQDSWNEINDSFFAELEKLTEFKAAHNKFYCVLSIFNSGISNWGGDKVMRHWDRNPFTQRRITAHEIVISHFFFKAEC